MLCQNPHKPETKAILPKPGWAQTVEKEQAAQGTTIICAPRAEVLATWPLLEPPLTERTFYTEAEAAPCPSTATE